MIFNHIKQIYKKIRALYQVKRQIESPFLNDVHDSALQNIFEGFKNVWSGNEALPYFIPTETKKTLIFGQQIDTRNRHVEWMPGEYNQYVATGNKLYKDKSIVYTFNNQGFRAYNCFGGKKQIACFGCSGTFGVGLPDEETWPWILQHEKEIKYNYTVKNYGVSGASNDYICRLVYTHLLKNKPDIIICFFPDIYRVEYFSEKRDIETWCPRAYPEHIDNLKKYKAYLTLINPYNGFFNFVKNFKFIELMCKQQNIKFVWHTWSTTLLNTDKHIIDHYLGNDSPCIINRYGNGQLYDICRDHDLYDISDKARDGAHQGVKFNKILAKEFVKLINC